MAMGYNPGGNVQPATQTSPFPVSDEEGAVYVNTGSGLFAFDHISGRQRWSAKPKTPAAPDPQKAGVMQFPMYNQLLAQTWFRWAGATSASLGGGKVFGVEVMGQGYQIFLALSAFNASNGKRLWSFVQTDDGGDFEAGAYFPWAPKFIDGQLIALACHRDQMYLCSLDAETG